jgi:hypothetical protein
LWPIIGFRPLGRANPGLEAQRRAIREHLNGSNWQLIAEFTEVESGKRSDRPKLAEALKVCRLHGTKLTIAKLDRLARNVAFITPLPSRQRRRVGGSWEAFVVASVRQTIVPRPGERDLNGQGPGN